MTASNHPFNAGDRVILMTIILLLILLMIFVFALTHITNGYQNNKQEYSEIVEPRVVVPQVPVKPAPANKQVTPPLTVAVAPAKKPASTPPNVAATPPPVRKKYVAKPAPVTVAKQPPKPIIKKETRLAQPQPERGYFKLGPDGRILPHDASEWVCVQDRATGLIWEVKTDDNSMRDRDNFFTWYEPATEHNHGRAGARNGGRCKGGAACDTRAYTQAMNQRRLCGFSDWRLPTKGELLSLVQNNDGSTETNAKIAAKYFPRTAASWYWTATSNPNKPDYAWFVLFGNGQALNALKRHPKHVRLVRSTKSEKKTLQLQLALSQ